MVEILDIPITSCTSAELDLYVLSILSQDNQKVISFVNPEFLVEAHTNTFLRRYLQLSDRNLADGVGLLWAAKKLKKPLPERITGTEFVHSLCKLSQQNELRLFFLGGAPGIAERAKESLSCMYPDCKIVGTATGYFNEDKNESIIQKINDSQATVLMVCMGNPKQERWIAENRHKLNTKLVFGNGGALDFAAGVVKRAPKWVQNIGCEWLYRLGQDFTIKRINRQLKLVKFVKLVREQIKKG